MSDLSFSKIDVSSLKKLDIPASAIRKLSDREIATFKSLVAPKPPAPTPAQTGANKPYAQIWKDGKMIGEVYKGGSCMTVSNAIGMKLQSFFQATDDRDLRAQAIAKATGGTIKYV